METIYRQKAPHRLTKEQFQAKLQKDSEYEIAVQNLSGEFYRKKRSVGVTAEEEEVYKTQKAKLWNDYLEWAKANGLYEEFTPEQQLAEAKEGLDAQITDVNLIRAELGYKQLEIREKAEK